VINSCRQYHLVPTTFLGVDASLGSIKKNKRACMTIVDNDLTVKGTIVDGKPVFISESILKEFELLN